MNIKALETLEFNKIKKFLENYAVTYIGKEKVQNLLPSSNSLEIEQWQKETTEATSYLLRQHDIPLAPISNIENSISKINIGGVLSIKELLQVTETLRVSRNLKNSFSNGVIQENEFTIINEYFQNLYTNKKVEDEIERCIKTEEELDDRASQELYKLRKEIKDNESRIKEKLNSILRSSAKYLQDNVITIRDDRYVIPVKAEYKNEVPGLIHDQSATGSTIFVEPTSIFNMNNEIKELKLKEDLEIQRILSLLTQMIAPITSSIQLSINYIGMIDFAFAKGRYSISQNAFSPILTKDFTYLKNARHPLIPEDKVVPITIWIGKEFNTLIITGPNTGGKTVTLKTCGLLSLMTQSGLHIPCDENSSIKIYNNIYTDIGDEQSIEQSLSTFSSHMTNIVSILKDFTKDDLILIDEIGSGTDPIEGAALAMSILKYLHENKVQTIATTHYSELKSFAIQTEGVENASCEFDVETLKPTYKLLIGVPGKSNAFAISKKLGLSENILKNAEDYLTDENIKFEDVLQDMEYDRIKAQEEREISKKLLADAEAIKKKAEEQQLKIEKQKFEILSKAKEKARDLLLDAEEEANDIIKELTNIKNSKKQDAGKQAENQRQKLKKSLSEIQNDLMKPDDTTPINSIKEAEAIPGVEVYIPSLEQEATIIKSVDKNGDVMVQSGIIKLKIHISKIEKLKKNEDSKKSSQKYGSKTVSKTKDISTEVNLIGMTVDEAIPVLEKYIDDAYLSNVGSVRIVHGKGTGILRKAVQSFLSKHPHIKSYRLGMYGEGDSRSNNSRDEIN